MPAIAAAPANAAPAQAPSSERNEAWTLFLGEPEAPLLEALATEAIVSVEKGRGGRSLAFKVTLASGLKGYFKPEQTFSAAHYYAELASYHLDRELELGRVPPTVGRYLEWAPLYHRAQTDERVEEIVVQDDGTVRGALIAWIDGGLEPISPPEGWTGWFRIRDPLPVSPFQRPSGWNRDRRFGPERFEPLRHPQPEFADRPRELSDLILFDYLTTNVDRWGGDFTNLRTRGVRGPLIYLDNGAGFSSGPTARIPLMDARLRALQRFDRGTVSRIRTLTRDRLEARMARDPLAPILNDRQWRQLEERRRHLLAHVDETVAEFGEEASFPWKREPTDAP